MKAETAVIRWCERIMPNETGSFIRVARRMLRSAGGSLLALYKAELYRIKVRERWLANEQPKVRALDAWEIAELAEHRHNRRYLERAIKRLSTRRPRVRTDPDTQRHSARDPI